MLEKQIEKAVCDYAKSKGILVYKFSSPAHRSVPDRMFITPEGHMFMIEFKSAKGRVTSAQVREMARLTDYGISVFLVRSIENGRQIIDKEWFN